MGQRSSSLSHPKISLARLLGGSQQQQKQRSRSQHAETQMNFSQDNPSRQDLDHNIENGKEQLKWSRDKHERRRSETLRKLERNERFENRFGKEAEKEISWRAFPLENVPSEKDTLITRNEEKATVKRAISEPTLMTRESIRVPSCGRHDRQHGRPRRSQKSRSSSRFCYEISDVDFFLTKTQDINLHGTHVETKLKEGGSSTVGPLKKRVYLVDVYECNREATKKCPQL